MTNVFEVAQITNTCSLADFIMSLARDIDTLVSRIISVLDGSIPSSISFILCSAGIALYQQV